MKTISATNLRVQLRDLLADLDSGPVSITKHGKVVAVLSAPGEPVEAVEATPTTEDTSEAPDASQSPPEPTLGSIPVSAETLMDIYDSSREDEEEAADPASRWGTEEIDDPLDGLDADFEAYLSSQARMDRPMP
jgi:antitoxin (DNA-binding transcriptional repressor) of toxin-antitoxin stability system